MSLFLTTLIAFTAGAGLSTALNDGDALHAGFYCVLFAAYLIRTVFYNY